MDNEVMSGRAGYNKLIDWLNELKQVAIDTNKEYATLLNINQSKQIGLVKPSGTVSQLCSTASGIHPRFAKFYIRRVTQDVKDPLTDLMISEGIPYSINGDKVLFNFPIKSPDNAVVDISSIDQLDLWFIYRQHWCDGNPSQTIYYTDDSFLDIQSWVWKNWDYVGGLSFFPKDDNIYENNPFESIDEDTYNKLASEFPIINWSNLKDFEKEDSSKLEVAIGCSGGSCEL